MKPYFLQRCWCVEGYDQACLLFFYRSKTVVYTDNRIRIMNEVVSGIRIIKMYAWEKPFSALVTEVRR